MGDVTVRSDSVDVEQIMEQIRARIREKRGADYTEAELHQLATTNLRKFLDPKGVRSDLVEHFRKGRKPAEWANYEFGETTLYESHRAFVRTMRKLLRPVLKLFFNPDPIVSALHIQSQLNTEILRESLRYELVHNLVVELTRASIELQNVKMRVESLSSRLDFDERRARSLESVVEYRQPPRRRETAPEPGPQDQPQPGQAAPAAGEGGQQAGAEDREGGARRRRRRRRRRPGSTLAESGAEGQPAPAPHLTQAEPATAPEEPDTSASEHSAGADHAESPRVAEPPATHEPAAAPESPAPDSTPPPPEDDAPRRDDSGGGGQDGGAQNQ